MAFNEYTFPNGQNQIPFQSYPLALNNSQLSVGFTVVFAGKFNEITQLLCEICGLFVRNDIKECELHVRMFHPMLKEYPYIFLCDTCDSAFDSKIKATRHHNGHMPRFQCDYCDRNFDEFYDLNYHQVEEHQLSSKKTFKCKQCGNKFRGGNKLREHKLKCNQGYHFCNKCFSVFESKYLLYEHNVNCEESADPNAVVSSNLHMLDDLLDTLNGSSSTSTGSCQFNNL